MYRNMYVARIVYILTVCSNIFFLPARVVRSQIITSVPTRNPNASLLPSGGCHCTKFGKLVTSLKTAIFVVDMCRVSIYRVWSFLGTNKMVHCAQFGHNNTRGNSGKVTLVKIFYVETATLKATCADPVNLNRRGTVCFRFIVCKISFPTPFGSLITFSFH